MGRWRELAARLLGTLRRDGSEKSLAKEMAEHLAMIEEDFRRQGLSPEEAQFAAKRAFGPAEQTKERYRDQRGFVQFEQWWQDLRHSGRSLRNSPGFATVAVLSLAFGIGVNTAIFTLVHGILLERLPMPEAERVVQLRAYGKGWKSDGLSYPQMQEIARQKAIFSDVTGFSSNLVVLDAGADPQRINLELITGNYFSFFHAEPALGRLINEEDDRVEGAESVCVLSYQTWKSRFGGDPHVVGRVVRINTAPIQVVGVAGPDFTGAELQSRYDMWVPTAMALPIMKFARSSPKVVWISSLAKLQPGLSGPEALARLKAASKGINEVLPRDRANADGSFNFVEAQKGFDTFRTQLRQPLVILMAAVALVLLIACANLTNLLLARASERQREFSVKLSLGISRGRLMRQLLIETFLLTIAGGLIAVLAARGLLAVLLGLFNAGASYDALTISIDSAALVFTFAVCGLTTMAVGLYPSWWAIRTDLTTALKGGGFTGVQKRFARRAMIVVQVSLAVVLLFGASLFSRSLRKLKTVDLGFDIEHVAVIGIGVRGKEPLTGPPALHDVLDRTRQIVGVESADLASPSMLSGESMTSTVKASESSKTGAVREADNTFFVFTSPQYFATLRMPLQRGRDFTNHDRKGTPAVAIVNERLASLLWPGQDPLGKQMIGGWNGENPQVIGVVGNSKYTNVRNSVKPIVYEPLDQTPVMSASLEVRSRVTLTLDGATDQKTGEVGRPRVSGFERIDNGVAAG